MEPQAAELLQGAFAMAGAPAKSKVIITDYGTSYYFSVVVCAGERIFSNETFVEKQKVIGHDRLWQLDMLVYLVSDIVRRLK